jgi:hypothetical protein
VMRHQTLARIKSFPVGDVIHLQDVYSYTYKHFPKECDDLGFMGKQVEEPKWKNDSQARIPPCGVSRFD